MTDRELKNQHTPQKKRLRVDERELRIALGRLCFRVAAIDDAGLTVDAKSTIAEARRLRRFLSKVI